MLVAFLSWITARNFYQRSPIVRFGIQLQVGNFENFSHYWNRRIPICPNLLLMFGAIHREVGDGYVAIDVGANLGVVTLALAESGFKRVLAVEPTPATANRLRENIRMNPQVVEKITVLQVAVGEKPGEVFFYVSQQSPEQNKVSLENSDEGGQIRVEMTTIDEIMATCRLSQIGLLKIDIEGFEYQALKGASRAFETRSVRFVYLELIPQALTEAGTSMDQIEGFFAENFLFPKIWTASDGFQPSSLIEALKASGDDRSVLFALR